MKEAKRHVIVHRPRAESPRSGIRLGELSPVHSTNGKETQMLHCTASSSLLRKAIRANFIDQMTYTCGLWFLDNSSVVLWCAQRQHCLVSQPSNEVMNVDPVGLGCLLESGADRSPSYDGAVHHPSVIDTHSILFAAMVKYPRRPSL